MKSYLLGVDGGGTKTDYGLFTIEGTQVDVLHQGTRNHEALEGGFEEAEMLLHQDITGLLGKHHIMPDQVFAALGLAGIDTPSQLHKMNQIIEKHCFRRFIVSNDSVLGIKAGCSSGIGICSINGTGTVASGINNKGEILQIGGIGGIAGDFAGGILLAMTAVSRVYESFYRFGKPTLMADKVLKLLNLSDPSMLLSELSAKFVEDRSNDRAVLEILFESAAQGDEVAYNIVRNSAESLARSVAGCMLHLGFTEVPEVVLAGSVWTKARSPIMLSGFIDDVAALTGMRIDPTILSVAPMAGAVLWALELSLEKSVPLSLREKILNAFV